MTDTDGVLSLRKFSDVKLSDPFFDSLKADYPGFENWFEKKKDDKAFVSLDEAGNLQGFLYTKQETEELTDITPSLPALHRLKIGTFKVNAHGTKLGERFIKKIFDIAVACNVSEVYVTVFPKHEGLVSLLSRYGFGKVGEKMVNGMAEDVMSRSMTALGPTARQSYPLMRIAPTTKHVLLSIYPEYHSRLFPDSLLKTEDASVMVTDTSATNSIHKVYLCKIPGVEDLKPGDIVLIYRTKEGAIPAEYSAVATSVCVVEEFRWLNSFPTLQGFLEYALPYSVFTKEELTKFYTDKQYNRVIRFSYNIALPKRIIRKRLIEEVGFDRDARWTSFPITEQQLKHVLKLGGASAGLIVDTP